VSRSLSRSKNSFASIALEPTVHPVQITCPRCHEKQRIDAAAIDVLVPEAGDSAKSFLTWPFSDPFESIGQPDED
jgi:hypothetical protein